MALDGGIRVLRAVVDDLVALAAAPGPAGAVGGARRAGVGLFDDAVGVAVAHIDAAVERYGVDLGGHVNRGGAVGARDAGLGAADRGGLGGEVVKGGEAAPAVED